MKTFKRIVAWLVLGVCSIIPCAVYTFLLSICHKSSEMLLAFLIADILALGFAFSGFFLPQIIYPSKRGLRYRFVSILNIYFGVVVILFTFAWAIEYSYSAIFILISAINPYSIFGIILFNLQRKKYKCPKNVVLKEEPLYNPLIENTRFKRWSMRMRKNFASSILILFGIISIITSGIIENYLAEKRLLAISTSTLATILIAIGGFYASQYFSLSEKGLRYKVLGIIFAIRGSETLLYFVSLFAEDIDFIFSVAKLEVISLSLISLFDTYLVFAIVLYILYRKSYKGIK